MLPADSEYRQWETIERLVYKIAGQVYQRVLDGRLTSRISKSDLVQEGAATWLIVCEKYNPNAGAAFSTYFTRALYTNLNRYVDKHGNIKHGQVCYHNSIDQEVIEDGSTGQDLIADPHTPMPDEVLEVAETLKRRMNSMSLPARLMYQWLLNPPEWLVEEIRATKAFWDKRSGIIGAKKLGGPQDLDVVATAFQRMWDLSDEQLKAVRREVMRYRNA